MAGEWCDEALGDIAEITTGKLDSNAAVSNGLYPFFTCSPDTLRIDKYAFDCEAVLLAGNNANGVFTVKHYQGKFNAYQRTYVITAKDHSKLHTEYLYYQLTQLVELLRDYSIGTATRFLTLKILNPLPIPLPSLPEQRAIAHILGTLDDKIELNRRMNETLEAMAQAIFKSWFVDFDPVRAKAEGRDTGLPKHIAGLFPDSFEDSELGEVPEGWQPKYISDLADVVGGSTPSTSNPQFWENGSHCWATPKDLSALKSPVLLDTERRITDAGLAQISSGLLPAGTVLLSSRAPIGYLTLAEIPVAINQGFIAMKAKKAVPKEFLLLWARSAQEDILSRANGSTFLEINKANFRLIPVVRPPDAVLSAFESIIKPLYRHVVGNERESRTLAALRDTLLPRLISGELRVKDAEGFVEKAL